MKSITVDLETDNLEFFNGIIWMVGVQRGRKSQIYSNPNGLTKKDLQPLVKELVDENIRKIFHNAAFDVSWLEWHLGIRIKNFVCTMINEIVIQGVQIPKTNRDLELLEAHSSKLLYVLPRYGFPKPNKDITKQFINRPKGLKFTKEENDYLIEDIKYLEAIFTAQEMILTRDGELETALLEQATLRKIVDMKLRGIGWNGSIWKDIAEVNTNEFNKRMAKLPKTVANWNSNKQVKDFFYDRGVLIKSYDELEDVYAATKDKILKQFIEARELHKAVTSYGINWFTDNMCDPDGRIRCGVQQIINTGRMSMMEPNLQQLPAKGLHRSAFVPAKGHKFVIGDFSGQEMGIMAANSGEDLWIDAMLRGDDIHALTASMLYADEWVKGFEKGCVFPKKCNCAAHGELRDPTKILNFMLAYGGGPEKFAYSTKYTFEEAKVIIKRYKKVVPRVTMWLNRNGEQAKKSRLSYSADPYKRRRVLRGQEEWQVVNQGKNNPVQAAGANMLKLAMISLPESLPIVLVIHDEIILEVKTSEAKSAAKTLKATMEKAADYITGIKGLVRVAPRISDNLMKK